MPRPFGSLASYELFPRYSSFTLPVHSLAMNQSHPTFEFCRTYDGSEPASRWLKRLEFELRGSKTHGVISSEQYLSSVDLLLMGEAADWAESSPEISALLVTYTSESLDRFLSFFKERFPTKFVEIVATTFPEEVEGLRQNADESLTSYYQRTIQITHRFGARDRLPGGPPLSTLESSMLDLIYGAFLKGLLDSELRREAIRGTVGVGGRSLHAAFVAMEEAYKSRVIIKKIEYEEIQSREAVFYKDVVKRNVTATQLESMWTSYAAERVGNTGNTVPGKERLSQQFLLPPPDSKQPSQPAIESKSVTWSVGFDSSEPPRSILKKNQEQGFGVVSAGSITASAGYGGGAYGGYEGSGVDQGVG